MSWKDKLNNYLFKTTLPGSGKRIEFRPLNVKQMKMIMANQSDDNEENDKLLDTIISESVTDKEFKVYDLYIQDRYFLITEIAKKTKGEKTKLEWKCPECNSQTIQVIDYNQMKVTRLNFENDEENLVKVTNDRVEYINVNPIIDFNFGVSVKMEPIKRSSQIKAMKMIKEKKKDKNAPLTDTEINEMTIYMYADAIKKVITDGEEEVLEFEEKLELLDSIEPNDFEKLNNWINDNDFGYTYKYEFSCPHCDYKEENEVEDSSFF